MTYVRCLATYDCYWSTALSWPPRSLSGSAGTVPLLVLLPPTRWDDCYWTTAPAASCAFVVLLLTVLECTAVRSKLILREKLKSRQK